MKVQDRISLFIKKYKCNPESFEELCPRWDVCSVNKCPLHKDFHRIKCGIDDKSKKCKCPKTIKRQIKYYRDSNKGMILEKDLLFTQGKNIKIRNNTITKTITHPVIHPSSNISPNEPPQVNKLMGGSNILKDGGKNENNRC